MAATPKYLVLFYGVSSGANGANLGSDERDLVTLVYLVLNTEENKVRITLHYMYILVVDLQAQISARLHKWHK